MVIRLLSVGQIKLAWTLSSFTTLAYIQSKCQVLTVLPNIVPIVEKQEARRERAQCSIYYKKVVLLIETAWLLVVACCLFVIGY